MAFSKAKSFDQTKFLQSLWHKARAHPARIIILDYLEENGITPFATLNRMIALAPTTVSQHLHYLVKLNLIKAEEKFPHTSYKLNTSMYQLLKSLFDSPNEKAK